MAVGGGELRPTQGAEWDGSLAGHLSFFKKESGRDARPTLEIVFSHALETTMGGISRGGTSCYIRIRRVTLTHNFRTAQGAWTHRKHGYRRTGTRRE